MNDLSESLLDRLTHPLRIDRQLQQEVRRELSTHLHDAIAENRAAGMNDEEAQRQAIRALGDEKLLSEQLWRANRRRIRTGVYPDIPVPGADLSAGDQVAGTRIR